MLNFHEVLKKNQNVTEWDNSVVLIPDGTVCNCIVTGCELVDESTNQETGEVYKAKVKIQFTITEGEYKGTQVNQNCAIFDDKPQKQEKAMQFLALLDNIQGHKFSSMGEEVSTPSMSIAWNGAQVEITVNQWSMKRSDGSEMKGNNIKSMRKVNKTNSVSAPSSSAALPADTADADDIDW
jgi:hypothetical protein